MAQPTQTTADLEREAAPRRVAVIDIGTTAIRMATAELDARGGAHILDRLQKPVALGKDTFTSGVINRHTTEECVEALTFFRRILNETGIEHAADIRAVATSAVREALNRDAFLDRVAIGSGFHVEIVDQAEINRYTYLGVQPLLQRQGRADKSLNEVVVVEVGGGGTALLAIRSGKVIASHGHSLGSLRMREVLEDFREPAMRLPELLANQIETTVNHIHHQVSLRGKPALVALGGDARFAALHLLKEPDLGGLAKLPVSRLARFTQQVLALSVDDTVRRFNLPYPDAETLGPALLAYTRLAEALRLKEVLVTEVSLRHGLLADMAGAALTPGFTEQILHSAGELGRRYDFDEPHARQVAGLALEIFRALRNEHQLPPRYETLLNVAALLHEIGLFVSNRSHHKHSLYLIRNSEVFGLGERDMLLAGLIARYHRRALPKPSHDAYTALDRDQRLAVSKLAAILRVADALDAGHTGRVKALRTEVQRRRLTLTATRLSDVSVERLALQQKGPLFEQVYGMGVVLRPAAAPDVDNNAMDSL